MEAVRKVIGRKHGEGMVRRQKILRTNLNGEKELDKPKIKKMARNRKKRAVPGGKFKSKQRRYIQGHN